MNFPVIEILAAQYLGNHALKIQFNNGFEQIISFKSFIFNHNHPDVAKYRDESKFKAFSICNGDLEWNDYELCFPIADLYENKNIEIESTHAA